MPGSPKDVHCVVVGDNGVGKTTLLARYITERFCGPDDYFRVFDGCETQVIVNNQSYMLSLMDTYTPEEHDRIGPLYIYPEATIFLLCFSVVERRSFESVERHWRDKLEFFRPEIPWLLVGTQVDRRQDPVPGIHRKLYGPSVTTKEGQKMARRIGASKYIECSALEDTNVKETFVEAVIASENPRPAPKRKNWCIIT